MLGSSKVTKDVIFGQMNWQVNYIREYGSKWCGGCLK